MLHGVCTRVVFTGFLCLVSAVVGGGGGGIFVSSNVAVVCWGFLCPVMLLCVSGFLCPVHTPDGTPCGLLNHMSASCQVRRGVLPSLLLSQCLYLFYIYVALMFYPIFLLLLVTTVIL